MDPKKGPGPDATPAPEPQKGGFGAFADKYRTRWAVNHPHMRPWEYEDTPDGAPAAPEPAEPAKPTEQPPRSSNGTRLHRPED
jgi:hypothetical protein